MTDRLDPQTVSTLRQLWKLHGTNKLVAQLRAFYNEEHAAVKRHIAEVERQEAAFAKPSKPLGTELRDEGQEPRDRHALPGVWKR